MIKHSFSDFSYAVNIESKKKKHKEVLVCFIYNGVEVLKKVYVPEGQGVAYVFEAKKIIDQEMRNGDLATYSHKFIFKNRKKGIQPKKIVAAVARGEKASSVPLAPTKVATNKADKPKEATPKNKGGKKWLIVGGCVAVVAALVLGTYFLTKSLTSSGKKEYPVSFETTGCEYIGDPVVQIGKKYECTFTPAADESVAIDYVKMGDKTLNEGPDGYTFVDDTLTIQKVASADIKIKAHTNPNAYKVTFNGVGCTLKEGSPTTVAIGGEYECDILAQRTTESPIVSKITMGGAPLTDLDYTFTGSHLRINKGATGPINITASVETTTFNVTYDAPSGIVLDGLNTVKKGNKYECFITCTEESGAVSIDAVRMGGTLLTPAKDYTYGGNNRLNILKDADGDINIVVSIKQAIYEVNYHLTYCELKDDPIVEKVAAGTYFECNLKKAGGTRKNMITGVSMGGVNLQEGDYGYTFVEGDEVEGDKLTVNLPASGNLVISAISYEPTVDSYPVKIECNEGCIDPTPTGGFDPVTPGESFSCGLYVSDKETKKVHIDAVVMGGISLKEGEGYTFDKTMTSGNNFTIGKVVGNVLIKFEAVDIGDIVATPTYKVSAGGDYLIVDGFTSDKEASKVQTMTIPAQAESPTTNAILPVKEIEEGALNPLANLQELSIPFIGRRKLADGEDPRDGSQLFGYIFGDTPYAGATTTWQNYYDLEGVSHPRKAIIPISLKTVTITGEDKIVPAGAFSGCRCIEDITFEKNAATVIKNCAFQGCVSLKNAAIPSTVTIIEEFAFENCTTLQHIDMPSNLATIASYAFRECQSLYKVYLSETIEEMGAQAFTNIRAGVIACGRTKKEVENAEFWSDQWVDLGTSVVYGAESAQDYIDINDYHYMLVRNDDNELGAYVAEYVGNTAAKSITVPKEVTQKDSNVDPVPIFALGDYMFSEYYVTETFVLNCTEVTSIGSYCFSYCTKLTKLENFENLTKLISIGAYSLGATAISSLTIPSSVETIGEYAFAYCDFTTFDLSQCAKLKEINEGLFYYCYYMQTVTLPSGITYLGENIFEGCSALTELTLNTSGIDTIPYALIYCTADLGSALTSFTWKSTTPLVSIGGSAFGGCNKMTSFIVDNGTTTTTNTIPNTVTNFGDYAFVRCTSITQLTIPAANPVQDITMGLEVFKGWTDQQTLQIAQDLTSGAGIFITEVTTSWGWNLSRGIGLDWYHFNCKASGSEKLVVYVNG